MPIGLDLENGLGAPDEASPDFRAAIEFIQNNKNRLVYFMENEKRVPGIVVEEDTFNDENVILSIRYGDKGSSADIESIPMANILIPRSM